MFDYTTTTDKHMAITLSDNSRHTSVVNLSTTRSVE